MRFPKSRRLKRLQCFITLNLGIAFLVGHYLLVFRQPVSGLIVLWYARYWWTQAILVPCLFFLLLVIAMLSRWLWQSRGKIGLWWHIVLQVGCGMVLPIYVTKRIVHLWFHLNNISIEDSGYMDSEFEVLKSFIILYNITLLGWYQYMGKELKHRRLSHAMDIIELKREKRRKVEFSKIFERSFIILLEKNNVCEVCYNGKVEALDIAEEKLEELLDYAYVQINRWTFVRMDCILLMDPDKELTCLRKEEEHVFNEIPTKTGFLKIFKQKTKHPNSLMALTKTYASEVIEKLEEYRSKA